MHDDARINNSVQARAHSRFFCRETMQDAICEVGGFSHCQRDVLFAFARQLEHPKDAVAPGVAWLVNRSGYQERAVQGALAELEKSGDLVLRAPATPRTAASYCLGARLQGAYERLVAAVEARKEARGAIPAPLEPARGAIPAPPGAQTLRPSSTQLLDKTPETAPRAGSQPVMTFGKYRGQRLSAIDDRSYLEWALTADKAEAELRAAIQADLERRDRADDARYTVPSAEKTEARLARERGDRTKRDPEARRRGLAQMHEVFERIQEQKRCDKPHSSLTTTDTTG